jgi:methylase of polypeptide subunit release factors
MSDIILKELNEAKSNLDLAVKNQDLMKKANAILRKKITDADKEQMLTENGFTPASAKKIIEPDFMGRTGFPQYKLTNNNGKIKRLKTRVSMLEKKENSQRTNVGEERYSFDNGEVSGEVLINYDIDRVQILFPGGRVEKPLFRELRSNGYVYSRTNEAFQRKITPQAIRNAIGLFNATRIGETPDQEPTDAQFNIGDYIKYPKATDSGKVVSVNPGSFGFEYKVEYLDGETITITDSDKPVKGIPPKTNSPIVKIDGKSYDMSEVMLPEDHPIMILDHDSPQWKSSVKEYFDKKDEPSKYVGKDVGNGRIIKAIDSEFREGSGYATIIELNKGVPYLSKTSVFGHKFYDTKEQALTTGVEDMLTIVENIISRKNVPENKYETMPDTKFKTGEIAEHIHKGKVKILNAVDYIENDNNELEHYYRLDNSPIATSEGNIRSFTEFESKLIKLDTDNSTPTNKKEPKFFVGNIVKATNVFTGKQKEKPYTIIESQGWSDLDNDFKYLIDDGNGVISEIIAEEFLTLVGDPGEQKTERTGWTDANDYEGQVYEHLVEMYDLTWSDAQGIAGPHEKLLEDGFNWGTKPHDVAIKVWESASPTDNSDNDLLITSKAVKKEVAKEMDFDLKEEVVLPNTPDEFDNVVLEAIIPHDDWESNPIKQRNIKKQIFDAINGPEPEKSETVARLFQLYIDNYGDRTKLAFDVMDPSTAPPKAQMDKIMELAQEQYALIDQDLTTEEHTKKLQELDNIKANVKPDGTIDTDHIINQEYKTPYAINRAIEKFLDLRNVFTDQFTVEEKVFIRKYSGYGGLKEINGPLDYFEFYTPTEVIKKMWALAYKYGYDNGSILEPSCGTGEFFQFAKPDIDIKGYDVSPYSSKICQILYPQAEILNSGFEEQFISKNWTVKDKVSPKFDMVIGNPPYGDFGTVASRYMTGMGEIKHVKARNYTEYFIRRGIDLLNPGGLLVFIVGASLQNGGTLFLDSPETPVKKYLADKCELLDAYRLGENVFERTKVTSEIIVLKKK